MKQILSTVLIALLVISGLVAVVPPRAAKAELSVIRNITFPVIGKTSFSDDFGDPRTGHTHEGNDIIGSKLLPLVAAVDGTVNFVVWPQATYGYMVTITDIDGYKYNYLHINNDTPGTDNGLGGGVFAYAPGIERGAKVTKGQLIGFMGDSGNAESTSPHLHFEIRLPDDTAIDPYQSLIGAPRITAATSALQQPTELWPYGDFMGGAAIALGNLDSDITKELVVGAGAGGGPHVRRFELAENNLTGSSSNQNGNQNTLGSVTVPQNVSIPGDFFAYDTTFRGGVDVATGDTDGDGVDEIITAPGAGGGPDIRIFKTNGTMVGEFMAYDPKFRGGVNVSAVDIDGDGKAEIITAPKSIGGPHVRIFKSTGTVVGEFMAYAANFTGGVDVTGVPAQFGNPAMVVTAAGNGGGPHIKTFAYRVNQTPLFQEGSSFYAYDPSFHGGVRISAGKVNNVYKIATAPASGGGTDFKQFSLDGTTATGSTAYEVWWSGGFDIAMGDNGPFVSTAAANRRVSVRNTKSPDNFAGRGPNRDFSGVR